MMKLNEMLLKRPVQISTFGPDYGCREADWGGAGKTRKKGGKRDRPSRIVSLILPEVRIPRDQYSAAASLFGGVTYYCRRNAIRAAARPIDGRDV